MPALPPAEAAGAAAGDPRVLRRWRLAFAVVLCAALWIALLPGGQGEDWFRHADKFRHAVAFMALYWMGWRGRVASTGWLLAILLGFGVLVEVAQSFTTWRSAELADVAADAAGLLLGWVALGRHPWDRVRPAT